MKKITGKNGRSIAIIEGDECISRFVKESGRLDHDQNMLPKVLKYIPKGGVVIDIGCYIADHAIAYAEKVGVEGHVFGFEPSNEAFRCMMFNMRDYDNFTGENKPVGRVGKKVGIQQVETNNGMNYLIDGGDIPVYSLDQLFIEENQIDRIDFIKIDCEGYELDVLIGGQKVISKYRPIMLIEINEMTLQRNGITREDIYEWLEFNGYTYKNIYTTHGLYEPQMDIICLPK